MIDRRRFIESSAAGALTAGLAARACAGCAAVAAGPRGPSLLAVLFDERFPDAVRFGATSKRQGLSVRPVRADMTELWYAELHPTWRREPRPVAGLTGYSALFCLAELARDYGMRVVHHGTHARRWDGAIEHLTLGPLSAGMRRIGRAGGLHDRPADWAAELAVRIARRERNPGWTGLPPASRAAAIRALTPHPELEMPCEQPLHSWVIAPPARERT